MHNTRQKLAKTRVKYIKIPFQTFKLLTRLGWDGKEKPGHEISCLRICRS